MKLYLLKEIIRRSYLTFLRGKKIISVKRVLLKENSKIDKYKAHLISNVYKSLELITIRLMTVMAAQNSLSIFQMNVKSTFLRGNLKVFIFFVYPRSSTIVVHLHEILLLFFNEITPSNSITLKKIHIIKKK